MTIWKGVSRWWWQPPRNTQALGRRGERLAARSLRADGYRVLARNVQAGVGEADVVCLDPDGRTIVIVEVKTRISRSMIPHDLARAIAPEANVHALKRQRLLAVTRSLAQRNRWNDRPIRIDVMGIDWPADGMRKPTIRHHVGAVTA